MKKLMLSLSLVLAVSSMTAAFAAIPQKIRIGTDPTYAPFESKMRRVNWLVLTLIWPMNCANASKHNVPTLRTHWMR